MEFPLNTINKIAKQAVSLNYSFSDDSLSALEAYLSQFLTAVVVEAHVSCLSRKNHLPGDNRRSVLPEDVIYALEILGYEGYESTLSLYLDQIKKQKS
jgi:histone H3/H4